MLVFETRLHIISFLIVLVELVFFFYQLVYYLSRPEDKKRLLYLVLLYLLIQHNLISGLVPDINLPVNIVLQNVMGYGVSFAMVMFLPFYFYKAFDLKQLKFHAYWGSLLFLFLPFLLCLTIPYIITGNLEASRKIAMVIPFFYALSLLYFLSRAIALKNKLNPDPGSKRELRSVFIGVILFIFLPVIAFFQKEIDSALAPIFHFNDGSQLAEAFASNAGLLVFTVLFIRQTVKQSRSEYNKLLESEIKLQELNAGLTIKVQERTRELEHANEQRTNTFINLAHETKTPLTLINNYLEEYIRKQGQTEELIIIKHNIEKLSRDIVNFFDIERIRKGLDIYDHSITANFSTILRDNMLLFKKYSDRKNIKIIESIEDRILVKADPESLCRIINNLIENSIKYTDLGGRIEISLKTINEKIIFSVKDNGIGISSELHNKIFEPYFQINSEKKNIQGMGMGLSIVKKIVDNLNGNIILASDSKSRSGTEISIHLDVYKGPISESLSEIDRNVIIPHLYSEVLDIKEAGYDEGKPYILLVEDNIPLLKYMIEKLNVKYNVYFASSGFEALDKLKTISQLDIIISDVMMDNGDGFYFYDGVAKQKRLKHIPFIFLTARTNIEDKLKGLALGAVDYMPKPFLIMELISKIDSVLNNLAEQREVLIHSTYRSLLQQNGGESISHSNQDHFDVNCDKFNLTVREKEIVRLISKGQTYKEIANTLHISDKTVGKHIQNMFEKVDASNKAELVNKLGLSVIA